jgi:hypothetical protein
MSIILFRKQIEVALSGLIGEYTLPNLTQTPAIRFREGQEQLDENIAVSGLEVVIEIANPKMLSPLYAGTPRKTLYHVWLVEWSGYNYDEAVMNLTGRYDGSYVIPITIPPELGPTKQCIVAIESSTTNLGAIKFYAP